MSLRQSRRSEYEKSVARIRDCSAGAERGKNFAELLGDEVSTGGSGEGRGVSSVNCRGAPRRHERAEADEGKLMKQKRALSGEGGGGGKRRGGGQ